MCVRVRACICVREMAREAVVGHDMQIDERAEMGRVDLHGHTTVARESGSRTSRQY